jgi:hypothetical protein
LTRMLSEVAPPLPPGAERPDWARFFYVDQRDQSEGDAGQQTPLNVGLICWAVIVCDLRSTFV